MYGSIALKGVFDKYSNKVFTFLYKYDKIVSIKL